MDDERWDALKKLLRDQRDAAQAMADTDKRPDAALLTGTVAFTYTNVLQLMQNLESMEQQKNAEQKGDLAFWEEEARAASRWLGRLMARGCVPEEWQRYVSQFTAAGEEETVTQCTDHAPKVEQQKNALGELTRMSEEMGGYDASPEDLAAIRTSDD